MSHSLHAPAWSASPSVFVSQQLGPSSAISSATSSAISPEAADWSPTTGSGYRQCRSDNCLTFLIETPTRSERNVQQIPRHRHGLHRRSEGKRRERNEQQMPQYRRAGQASAATTAANSGPTSSGAQNGLACDRAPKQAFGEASQRRRKARAIGTVEAPRKEQL